MNNRREIAIKVPVLARVEGEGALDIRIHDGQIDSLHLQIFEPPRLFEKMLEGRHYSEVPDMVARICGICPVAYQMSAVHAFEHLFGVDPGPGVRALRRLLYCGEWLQSHALHIHLLAAPDFLGFDNAIAMAQRFPDEVRRGLLLQSLGNELMGLIGGRSVHPVTAQVGGFTRVPSLEAARDLRKRLQDALPLVDALINWTAALELPTHSQMFTSVSLRHADEYPLNEGRLVSNDGLDISIDQFAQHFQERQVRHSTALHCRLHDAPYLVGPLARLNLNADRLPGATRRRLDQLNIDWPSGNSFHGIIARAIEIHFALSEAVEILHLYQPPDPPAVPIEPRAGIAYGCTEAPRGSLWHCYEVDDQGVVRKARIVPPTSQNQARIEADIAANLQELGLDKSDEVLRRRAETVVRNYDPCISCATHFLKLTVERT